MVVCNNVLYIILSYFDITACNDVSEIKLILGIELPECLLSTFPNDINKYHPFWSYWISKSKICQQFYYKV